MAQCLPSCWRQRRANSAVGRRTISPGRECIPAGHRQTRHGCDILMRFSSYHLQGSSFLFRLFPHALVTQFITWRSQVFANRVSEYPPSPSLFSSVIRIPSALPLSSCQLLEPAVTDKWEPFLLAGMGQLHFASHNKIVSQPSEPKPNPVHAVPTLPLATSCGTLAKHHGTRCGTGVRHNRDTSQQNQKTVPKAPHAGC